MDFFDHFNISERYMELLNPTSTAKVMTVGKMLGLKPGNRIIDFGCGFGKAWLYGLKNLVSPESGSISASMPVNGPATRCSSRVSAIILK